MPKRSQKLQLKYKQLFRNCVFKINTENAIKNFQRANIFHVNILLTLFAFGPIFYSLYPNLHGG